MAGPGDPEAPSWSDITTTVKRALRGGVKEWAGQTMVQGGTVQASTAILLPGSLKSPLPFESALFSALVQEEVPMSVSRALSRRLWQSWKEWADGFTITVDGLFPMFRAFPGPSAPPTPGVGVIPLSRGNSVGESAMIGLRLAQMLEADLPTGNGVVAGDRTREIRELADWIENSFRSWKAHAFLQGHKIMGMGPVPTFQPPHSPIGPVVGGQVVPGGSGVVSGIDFGSLNP